MLLTVLKVSANERLCDDHGVRKLYVSSNSSADAWTSNWSDARTLTGANQIDPFDARAKMKGSGTISMGSGIMNMTKTPRLYITSTRGFEDVEMTSYAKWVSDGTLKSYSGLTLVARTNHGDYSQGCTAAGYYARIYRSSGEAAFQKEYFHDVSGTIYSASRRTVVPEFADEGLPLGKTIGMKFIVRTLSDASSVKLELYLDVVANGTWSLVHEFTDTVGSWKATSSKTSAIEAADCGNVVDGVANGGTVLGARQFCFFRIDGSTDTVASWERASVRHIVSQRIDDEGAVGCGGPGAPAPAPAPSPAPTPVPVPAQSPAPSSSSSPSPSPSFPSPSSKGAPSPSSSSLRVKPNRGTEEERYPWPQATTSMIATVAVVTAVTAAALLFCRKRQETSEQRVERKKLRKKGKLQLSSNPLSRLAITDGKPS